MKVDESLIKYIEAQYEMARDCKKEYAMNEEDRNYYLYFMGKETALKEMMELIQKERNAK